MLALVALSMALLGGCIDATTLGDQPPTEVQVGSPPTWTNGVSALMGLKCAVCHQLPLAPVSPNNTPTYFDLRFWDISPSGITGALVILPFLEPGVGILRMDVPPVRKMPLDFATPLTAQEINALETWATNGGPLTLNLTPVANAGADQNVKTGDTVQMDGSASSDADLDTLTYAWSFFAVPAGSAAALSDASLVNPTFVADLDGNYTLSLVVNDGTVDSAADTVAVNSTDPLVNSVPIANAGPQQSVTAGATVTLDGSASSDADPADTLTYAWSFSAGPAGSAAALSDPALVNPTFVADLAGSYTLTLVVNDGTVDSSPDTVTITAAAVISAGETLFVVHCQVCHGVNGTGSGTAPNIQFVTKAQIDTAILTVTQMRIRPDLNALNDIEKQDIADFLGSF